MLQDNLNPVIEGHKEEPMTSTPVVPISPVPLTQRLLNAMFLPGITKQQISALIEEVEVQGMQLTAMANFANEKDLALKETLRQLEELKAEVDALRPKSAPPAVADPVDQAADVFEPEPSPIEADADAPAAYNPKKKSSFYK